MSFATLLAMAGCVADVNTNVMLDPPSEARSVALAVVQDNELEVQAFDLDDPPASLPADPDYEAGTRFSISVRYYPGRLEDLGIPSGVLPARELEEEFGPLPASSIPDAVRVVDDDGDTGWQEGALDERVQKFVSPALALDPSACFELASVVNVQLSTYESVYALAGGRGEALAASEREDATARVQLYFVHQEGVAWTADRIDAGPDAEPSLVALLGNKPIRWLASDPNGDFIIAACGSSERVLIAGHPDHGFYAVATSTTAGCNYNPVLHSFRDESGEQLWAYADAAIDRYVNVRSRWQYRDSIAAPLLRELAGDPETGIFGLRGERTVYRYSEAEGFVAEDVPFDLDFEVVAGLAMTARGPVVATQSGDLVGEGNRFYERTAQGWSLLDRNGTQSVQAVAPLYDGVVYSGVSSVFAQVSPAGTCTEGSAVSTGLWWGNRLVAIGARHFAVGGFKDSRGADPRGNGPEPSHGPNHIAIMEARVRAP